MTKFIITDTSYEVLSCMDRVFHEKEKQWKKGEKKNLCGFFCFVFQGNFLVLTLRRMGDAACSGFLFFGLSF